ncbi:hypothetical protein BLNAU_22919 [Blattamonas nauphoetae]|uniref:Uncharacterized protein n=1 Tax=Blattamonas nauphoetae TaxID=2049346 RepID=A0ABQ9WTW4_9EUKA|nr:hypothetical protein BLNAU_22919 [Blattamonas nauphoetae]
MDLFRKKDVPPQIFHHVRDRLNDVSKETSEGFAYITLNVFETGAKAKQLIKAPQTQSSRVKRATVYLNEMIRDCSLQEPIITATELQYDLNRATKVLLGYFTARRGKKQSYEQVDELFMDSGVDLDSTRINIPAPPAHRPVTRTIIHEKSEIIRENMAQLEISTVSSFIPRNVIEIKSETDAQDEPVDSGDQFNESIPSGFNTSSPIPLDDPSFISPQNAEDNISQSLTHPGIDTSDESFLLPTRSVSRRTPQRTVTSATQPSFTQPSFMSSHQDPYSTPSDPRQFSLSALSSLTDAFDSDPFTSDPFLNEGIESLPGDSFLALGNPTAAFSPAATVSEVRVVEVEAPAEKEKTIEITFEEDEARKEEEERQRQEAEARRKEQEEERIRRDEEERRLMEEAHRREDEEQRAREQEERKRQEEEERIQAEHDRLQALEAERLQKEEEERRRIEEEERLQHEEEERILREEEERRLEEERQLEEERKRKEEEEALRKEEEERLTREELEQKHREEEERIRQEEEQKRREEEQKRREEEEERQRQDNAELIVPPSMAEILEPSLMTDMISISPQDSSFEAYVEPEQTQEQPNELNPDQTQFVESEQPSDEPHADTDIVADTHQTDILTEQHPPSEEEHHLVEDSVPEVQKAGEEKEEDMTAMMMGGGMDMDLGMDGDIDFDDLYDDGGMGDDEGKTKKKKKGKSGKKGKRK